MARHVFSLQVQDAELLHTLNQRYEPALQRVTSAIPGLRGIAKYRLGDHYIELIDLDDGTDFGDFARQLAADPEVRQFLKQVDACFTQSLRDLAQQEMSPIQSLGAMSHTHPPALEDEEPA